LIPLGHRDEFTLVPRRPRVTNYPASVRGFHKTLSSLAASSYRPSLRHYPNRRKSLWCKDLASSQAISLPTVGAFPTLPKARLGKPRFRETRQLVVANSLPPLFFLFLTLLKIGHAGGVRKPTFHKTARSGWNRPDSFMPSICRSDLPIIHLFSHLPLFPPFPPHRPAVSSQGGRARIDRNALLRALVYRALRRLVSLSDLVQALRENPALREAIGLDPLGDIPSVERFSDWLRSTPNDSLQDIRIRLLQTLFAEGAFTGRTLALDSCPLLGR